MPSKLSTWAAKDRDAKASKPESLMIGSMVAARVTAQDSVEITMPYLNEETALLVARWLVATCGEEGEPSRDAQKGSNLTLQPCEDCFDEIWWDEKPSPLCEDCVRDRYARLVASLSPAKAPEDLVSREAVRAWIEKRLTVERRHDFQSGFQTALNDLLQSLPTLPPSQGTR